MNDSRTVQWIAMGRTRRLTGLLLVFAVLTATPLVAADETFQVSPTSLAPTQLLFSTYLGGSGTSTGAGDMIKAVAVDGVGYIYVTGHTSSENFPTTEGAYDRVYGSASSQYKNTDAFVAKLTPDGRQLVYSTFIGGASSDYATGIAVDEQGNAYVTGVTASTDFPTTPGAMRSTLIGWSDIFVLKLNSLGSALEYSTLLGGGSRNIQEDRGEEPTDIAVNGVGEAHIVGWTGNGNFPSTPGVFQSTYKGGQNDAFVLKLNRFGTGLVFASFLGGFDTQGVAGDVSRALELDQFGDLYVAGQTCSVDFPVTTGAFKTTLQYGCDGYVAKIAASGQSILYATFLGTTFDGATDIAVDNSGHAYVTGITSDGLPVTEGAFDTTFNGGNRDGFVMKLTVDGKGQVYSSYIGGSQDDHSYGIAVNQRGQVFITGHTLSQNFPLSPDAFQRELISLTDPFLVQLNASGSQLLYSSYFGHIDYDPGWGNFREHIALDRDSNAILAASTNSRTFPTTPDAFDPTYNGTAYLYGGSTGYTRNGFVAKFRPGMSIPPTCPGGQWSAEYFANLDLSGAPKATGCETAINKYWGTGAPKTGFPVDGFSVRWTTTITLTQTGWYRFRAFADDAVRLFIDGRQVFAREHAGKYTEVATGLQLAAGIHTIALEYTDLGGEAMADLAWYRCPGGQKDCDITITPYYQTDYPLVPIPETCPSEPNQTIARWGCLITSISMALQAYGIETNPVELNRFLSERSEKLDGPRGYRSACNGDLRWDEVLAFVKRKQQTAEVGLEWRTTTDPTAVIREQNLPVIVGVDSNTHWLLASEVAEVSGQPTLGIYDPHHAWACWAEPGATVSPPSSMIRCRLGPLNHAATMLAVKAYRGSASTYKYLARTTAPRVPTLQLQIQDVAVLIKDAQGRRLGVDPVSGQVLAEIPRSFYERSTIVPPGETSAPASGWMAYLPYPLQEKLQLFITRGIRLQSDAPAQVEFYLYDENLDLTTATVTLPAGVTSAEYIVEFDPVRGITLTPVIETGSHSRVFLPLIRR